MTVSGVTPQPDDLDLDAIEARAAAATPGPWWITSTTVCRIYGPDARERRNVFTPSLARVDGEADATFIAAARQDVPTLLAKVRALTDENERLKAERAENEAMVDFLDAWRTEVESLRAALAAEREKREALVSEFNDLANRIERGPLDEVTQREVAMEIRAALSGVTAGEEAPAETGDLSSRIMALVPGDRPVQWQALLARLGAEHGSMRRDVALAVDDLIFQGRLRATINGLIPGVTADTAEERQ